MKTNTQVCLGLAEVCRKLATYTEVTKKQRKHFLEQADIFEKLGSASLSDKKEIKTMAKLDKDFEKQRKKCISDLNKLEKRYDSQVFRSACNRKLTIDRQFAQRQKTIKQTEKELEQLKKGKPLPQY